MLFKALSCSAYFKDWRILAFGAGLLAFALWGSPTPNNPDGIEAFISIALILAVGWKAMIGSVIFNKDQKQEYWLLAAKIFFLYALCVPLITGLFNGWSFQALLRDIAALIFLCLPIFLSSYIKRQNLQKYFFMLCLIIGLIFSLRVLIPHFLLFRNTSELLYLANSPLVLMTAIFLTGYAFYQCYLAINAKQIGKLTVLLSLSALPIMAMFVDLQRASFAALVLSGLVLMAMGVFKAPYKIIMPALLILAAIFLFREYFTEVMSGLSLKTSQVGLNMREQEFMAVWQNVSQNSLTLFFGKGWGSVFESPAVGYLNVTFTHSLLSYILLKTGIIGLSLCLIYLYFIFEKLIQIFMRDGIKGSAFLWPFLIPILFYASHKSFDYGLMLTLIIVIAAKTKELPRT